MTPPPRLFTMKYFTWLPAPACPVNCRGVVSTNSSGKYGAPQSPAMVQSDGGTASTNRGMASVEVAMPTVETGANDTVSDVCTASPPPNGANPRNVGNCALSTT